MEQYQPVLALFAILLGVYLAAIDPPWMRAFYRTLTYPLGVGWTRLVAAFGWLYRRFG